MIENRKLIQNRANNTKIQIYKINICYFLVSKPESDALCMKHWPLEGHVRALFTSRGSPNLLSYKGNLNYFVIQIPVF